ncbi:hypothetical protein M2407_003855 [Serratia sp. BIGb0234]|jgi:hypothetical protein|nr:hypothetical protein [Serratia sp. BIGb0234]
MLLILITSHCLLLATLPNNSLLSRQKIVNYAYWLNDALLNIDHMTEKTGKTGQMLADARETKLVKEIY